MERSGVLDLESPGLAPTPDDSPSVTGGGLFFGMLHRPAAMHPLPAASHSRVARIVNWSAAEIPCFSVLERSGDTEFTRSVNSIPLRSKGIDANSREA
jgi:hypothetical protein